MKQFNWIWFKNRSTKNTHKKIVFSNYKRYICIVKTVKNIPLVEECTENIEETKLVENANENKHKSISCTVYIV